MKQILFISMLLFSFALYAQKNSVAINVTNPIIKALMRNIPDTSSNTIATDCNYARWLGNNYSMRIGVGGFVNYLLANNVPTNNTKIIDNATYNSKKFNIITSFYHVNTFKNKKIRFGKGISMHGTYYSQNRFYDTGFDIITTKKVANGIGIGPSIFLKYNITKAISIYSEYSIYFNTYLKTTNELSSYYKNTTTQLNHGIQWQFPVSIFLEYNF